VLPFENGSSYTMDDARAVAEWARKGRSTREGPFRLARILMKDLTGVPGVVDLATMRDEIAKLGGEPGHVNPPIKVDFSGTTDSLHKNMDSEFSRHEERYSFLRWGQIAFQNFRVVPPEVKYYRNGGMPHYVLREMARAV